MYIYKVFISCPKELKKDPWYFQMIRSLRRIFYIFLHQKGLQVSAVCLHVCIDTSDMFFVFPKAVHFMLIGLFSSNSYFLLFAVFFKNINIYLFGSTLILLQTSIQKCTDEQKFVIPVISLDIKRIAFGGSDLLLLHSFVLPLFFSKLLKLLKMTLFSVFWVFDSEDWFTLVSSSCSGSFGCWIYSSFHEMQNKS